jgi:hypothetical protein
MSTKGLIDKLKPYCSGFERSTGKRNILQLIQEAVDILFNYDSPYLYYIDAENNEGYPPYLLTTAGKYQYKLTNDYLSVDSLYKTVNGTNYGVRALRPLKVFRDSTRLDYTKRLIGQSYNWASLNPYTTSTSKLYFSDVPVDSGEAIEDESAWVRFKDDPGTTTQKYFVLFTWEHPRLNSESIPLMVPRYFEKAIEDYVIGTAQLLAHGQFNDRLKRWESKWIPEWRYQSSTGAQSRQSSTRPRMYG